MSVPVSVIHLFELIAQVSLPVNRHDDRHDDIDMPTTLKKGLIIAMDSNMKGSRLQRLFYHQNAIVFTYD